MIQGEGGIGWKILADLLILVTVLTTYGSFEIVAENAAVSWTYAIFAVAASITTGYMGKRTEEGAKLQGRILGFKDFLRKAEKDKLERLVDENPTYFYDILPYAYVLGVSDKWARNFEQIHILPPNWYRADDMGMFNAYMFLNHMNYCNTAMSNGIHIAAPESPSGGGGFSGGGGGFSGGGAGGGGGGSW